MSVVQVLSTFTYGLPTLTTSRSTLTLTLPSGTSRSLVLFGCYGNPTGTNTPLSGNTTPTFGGVALSEITRPTGGTNVMQGIAWITPISDGSSGDYALLTAKQATNDIFEAVGFFCSNVSSLYSSWVSTSGNASGTTLGLAGELVPPSVNSDLVIGVAFNGSGTTVSQTQLGEGTVVISNVTPGGNASGIYTPGMSAVTSQGDSSVSLQWSTNAAQRWRTFGLILYNFGAGSQITLAGTVVSSNTTSSAASSVCSVTVQKDGSTNASVMVFVSAYDAPNTGVLPIVYVDGQLASLMARNDAADPGGNSGEVRCSAWISGVTGTGPSVASVSMNFACGVAAMVMVGVDQGNPVSDYSTGGNNFSLGPLTSTCSASYGTQQAVGFGCVSFNRILTAGSGETEVSNLSWGGGSNASLMAMMVCTRDAVVPAVSFADTPSAAGRWRHTTLVLNLDGNIPPNSPEPVSPYFYRRRQHPSDW
jgi:hypothetical protein